MVVKVTVKDYTQLHLVGFQNGHWKQGIVTQMTSEKNALNILESCLIHLSDDNIVRLVIGHKWGKMIDNNELFYSSEESCQEAVAGY